MRNDAFNLRIAHQIHVLQSIEIILQGTRCIPQIKKQEIFTFPQQKTPAYKAVYCQ